MASASGVSVSGAAIAHIFFLRASSEPGCVWTARSCAAAVFFSFRSIHPGTVGNEGPKLGRKLLYSPLSFSFGVRGVGHLALRLNNAGVGYGLFPFGHCFLPFIHCFLSLNQSFLAYIQFRFALRKLRLSG